MRIAFLGSPDVAATALHSLIAAEDVDVAVVITNPDRPRGRSRKPVAPPVKVVAEQAGIPVWQPTRPVEVADDLVALEVDACAVVAYGALLSRRVLDAGGRGMVNLHFSLLPRWRGAAPVQHAIRAGDTVTGVTTFVLDEGMDTGPVLDQVEVPIQPDESAGDLLARLARIGAPVLVDSLRRLVAGEQPTPQREEGATVAPKITPDDVAIDFGRPAAEVADLVRSADPSPGAHTTFRRRRLKVFRAVPTRTTAAADRNMASDAADRVGSHPGAVVSVDRDGPVVACGGGGVRLEVVQPDGKARMDGAAFVNGYRPRAGEALGEAIGGATGDAIGDAHGDGS